MKKYADYVVPKKAPIISKVNARMLGLFRGGKDTHEISKIRQVPEHEVWRGIHAAQDAERVGA